MNEALLLSEVVLTFGAVVLAKRLFGLNGLIAWISVAMVLANLTTAKSVQVFGIDATLGTVMFASTFLAADCITESYGAEYARKGILIGICATVCFVVCTQIALAYVPSPFDMAHGSMESLFAINLRVSVASIAMCLIANLLNVWVFSKVRSLTKGRHMWLRSNVGSILCNCAENFAFVVLAFSFVYPWEQVFAIAVSTSIIEMALSVLDTPFLYLAKRVIERRAGQPCDATDTICA